MTNSQDEEFTYDLLGNRTSVELRDNTTVSYTHNNVNQYIDIGGCDPDVAHDDNGNLTRDHRDYEYQYDVDNRLIYVYNDSDAPYGEYDPDDTLYAEYQYDAMGRRIYSSIDSAARQYYYDGQRVIVETDGDGDFEQRYVFGNYIDEVLIIDDGTDDYYYGHDHLYSVVALFDDTGSVVERYEYDAYGAVQVMDASYTNRTTSSYDNPYTFTGRRLDELTSNLDIMYYRARYYDPETGRFMQGDPLQYVDGMNLYEYVKSGPVNKMDPSGLAFIMPPTIEEGEGEWGDGVVRGNDCSCEKYCYKHIYRMWESRTSTRQKWGLTARDYFKKLAGAYLKKALSAAIKGYFPTGMATGPGDYIVPAIVIETRSRECYYHRNCKTGVTYYKHCEESYELEYKASDSLHGWIDEGPTVLPILDIEYQELENDSDLHPYKPRWYNCLGNNNEGYLFPGERKITKGYVIITVLSKKITAKQRALAAYKTVYEFC